jgi:phosphoribosyl-AMP cyclohydrolase / phosphoribosyl-ATP pyrophosphohydrolase
MTPEDVSYDDRGLAPAIVQDAATKEVLMLAFVDAEALRRTLDTGTTWFWSRSRQEHWNKGATSGNVQRVIDVRYDCDADAVLMLVDPAGPACHTGENSCFYRSLGSQTNPD